MTILIITLLKEIVDELKTITRFLAEMRASLSKEAEQTQRASRCVEKPIR